MAALGIFRIIAAVSGLLLSTIQVGAAESVRAPLAERSIYVSVRGNDAWSGDLQAPNAGKTDGPLRTLTGARDRIRRIKGKEGLVKPVKVLVEAGSYSVTEPLVFNSADSGTADCPITYEGVAGVGGALPEISGGRSVYGWKKRGDLWVTYIPEVKKGQWHFGTLWVDGERRTRARTPNTGWLYTAGKLEEPLDKSGFRFAKDDMREWRNLDRAQVVMLHSWESSIHAVSSVDSKTGTVLLSNPSNWPIENWGAGQRYYLVNLPEFLDSPGEWHLDQDSGVLSYYPFPGEDLTKADVVAPVARQLIRLDGDPQWGEYVSGIRFRNLQFCYTDWPGVEEGHTDWQAAFTVSAAVEGSGVRNCFISDCRIAHIGNHGIWLRSGSSNNVITGNEITDMGAGGIRLGEGGIPADDDEKVTANKADNNFIHDGCKVFHGAVGIWVGQSSYNTISHNEICDMDYTGVSLGWTWGYGPSEAHHNIVEYNHIHDLGRGVLSDLGGIYTLGVSPGTVLRNNVIHDVNCYSGGYGGWGLYTDEGSSGILIENNLVYNTISGGFHQHYGADNTVRNNILAFAKVGQIQRTREEEHKSFAFERNIVATAGEPFFHGSWGNGKYTVDSNIFWDYTDSAPRFADMDFKTWKSRGRDVGSLLTDPLFIDPKGYDFRLQPGSPYQKVGFVPFDSEKAGLCGEAAWVELPKKVMRKPYIAPPSREEEPIFDEFEQRPVGASPARANIMEEGRGTVRITAEASAGGSQSLKFQDAKGLKYSYNPHLYYAVDYRKGLYKEEFDLRVDAGASMYHEWRDAGSPYRVGPSISVNSKGQLKAGNRKLADIPLGSWIHCTIICALGQGSTGAYSLEVLAQGEQKPLRFENLPFVHSAFRRLQWLGFVADGNSDAIFYLDNLSIQSPDVL